MARRRLVVALLLTILGLSSLARFAPESASGLTTLGVAAGGACLGAALVLLGLTWRERDGDSS